jgi:hypothetical protein
MAKLIRKLEIVGDQDNIFIIKSSDSVSGKVKDAEQYTGVKPMKEQEVGQILQADYKANGNRRLAWLTVLASVMANPRLDAYKGKGDRSNGKTSPEFRAAVRESEGEYLRKLVKDGAVKLHVGKEDNPDAVFQGFATSVREDKNYSNVKATVMKYFAFVGAAPMTKSGYLVPVPVMAMEVQNILDQFKEPVDTSYSAQIKAIQEALDKETSPSAEELAKALPEANRLFATIKGILDHLAELATHAATDIVAQTQAALDAANAKQPAPEPTKGKAKKAETA